MTRSDIAGFWSGAMLVVGAVVFFALGAGVGAQRISVEAGAFSSAKVTELTTTGGEGFNWLLAVLGAGPFVAAFAVFLAASWLLADVTAGGSVPGPEDTA